MVYNWLKNWMLNKFACTAMSVCIRTIVAKEIAQSALLVLHSFCDKLSEHKPDFYQML